MTVIALAALAAGCGTSTVSRKPEAPTPSHTASKTPASPSPAPQQQAHVGDSFTITVADGTKYQVTLLKLIQDAQPATQFDAPASGHHLAAAEFRVTATTTMDENANNDATATGSNEQAYTASLSSVAEGTNFANGEIRLQPGNSLAGWVTFDLPHGVRITRVQWTPSAGLGSQSAEWFVTGSSSSSAGQAAGPAATVRAYFAAINAHDYARAWNLGGRNTGMSYSSFVHGFSTTVRDTVTIVSTSGDVVAARLTAQETDGTVKHFQGTYTVRDGVIVHFDIQQVG